MAPIVLPVGAVLKQVSLYYLFPAGTGQQAPLRRKTFVGNYDDVAPPATLTPGPSLQAVVFDVTEPVNGTATYAMFVNTADATHRVGGLLVGYVAPPAQSFFPLPKITRVLDTRQSGGKLGPNEERTVTLGIPAGARRACST